MTFNHVPGEPYVTHCTLPVIRCSFSWAMVVLYIAASIYVTKGVKVSAKTLGRSTMAQGGNNEERSDTDPLSSVYSGRVVRAVIREQDGEMPKTSLGEDYPKGVVEKVFV
ncbi:unnamed protein product [Tuber aestivum]|uniref:Uncharacterized protein n=1 Tax=Tuber aestivum TaxID=59557 RepID=A0A292PTS1_9PEZI|nr:unnamed protein product [Tuber aestivum]